MHKHRQDSCPVAKVATLLSDAWTMLIIRDLLKESMRFTELEKSLSGISTRTLTSKIKNLEEEGIITKNLNSYKITKKGAKLKKVIDAMSDFGKIL